MIVMLTVGCKNQTSSIESKDNEATSVEVTESSYELMMSYVEQIEAGFTREQVVDIMGEPDMMEGSGIVYNYYIFDEYKVSIVYASDGLLLDIISTETGEKTTIY